MKTTAEFLKLWIRLLQSAFLMPLTAVVLMCFPPRQCKKKFKFSETQFFFKLSFTLCRNSIKEWMFLSPWCVSGLYLWLHYETLNYTVKREMKTVTEGAFIQEKTILQWRDRYESEFEFQKTEVWAYSLDSWLLKDTKQTCCPLALELQVRLTFPISRKSFPAPNGPRESQCWAIKGIWRDEQQGMLHAA